MPEARNNPPVKRGPYREDSRKRVIADREQEKKQRKAEEAETGVTTPPDPLGFDQQKIEPSGDVREYSGHDRTPDTDEAAGQPVEESKE